ncbi:MAG: YhdT family protein [Aminipila sp.]
MIPKLTEKEINLQIRKEVIISITLYLAFFVWWYMTGYGIAEKGTPETYTYVLGLPMWFFLSCIVGYVLFSLATIFVVKKFFKDFDLGQEAGTEEENI